MNLFSWSSVNDILRHHRLDTVKLRLMKGGEQLPPESFIKGRYGLAASELTNEVREGATLIINSVDEIYEPITLLVERLERRLEVAVQANMYASWRVFRGFDLHWDEHDVIVLQVAGMVKGRSTMRA